MAVASLLLAFFVVGGCLSEDAPSVTTKSGKIRGHYLTSYKGNRYEAYQGIPYAEPPIGDRRFQPPVPIQPWSSELNATKLKERCPQRLPVIGAEDCLYLNVFVPSTSKPNESLPVIFFIHGGSFGKGSPKESAEQFIMDYDVTYVSTQYRLGLLGFLSTENDVVPGNMGLKDQSTALRWVYENIEFFGGDPKKITLVGQSAGAVSVHFHYLSPWSRGLFHVGISMSGSAFAPWALTEYSREKVAELAKSLNCTNNDMRRVIECLKDQPVDVLVSSAAALPSVRYQSTVPFGPVVEKSPNNPFIDDLPSRIINRGGSYDVPWITGVVSEEALHVIASYANDVALKQADANWLRMAPVVLDYFYTIPMEQHNNFSQKIRKHYLGDKPFAKENFRSITNMVSDRWLKASGGDAARRQASANKSPVFFYHYSYRATDSRTNVLTKSTENLGVAHEDDLGLILKNRFVNPTKSPQDMAMQRRLIQLWTSVARYGVPKLEVEWAKVSANSTTFHYLQIDDPNNLKMQSSDNFAQTNFWHSIPFKEDTV